MARRRRALPRLEVNAATADSRSDSAVRSEPFKVVVPHVEVHRVARRSALAPQLACREPNGIHVLPFLSLSHARWCRGTRRRRGRGTPLPTLPRAYRGRRVWPVGWMLRARTRWPTLNDGRTFGSWLDGIPRLSQRADVARVSAGVCLLDPDAGVPALQLLLRDEAVVHDVSFEPASAIARNSSCEGSRPAAGSRARIGRHRGSICARHASRE